MPVNDARAHTIRQLILAYADGTASPLATLSHCFDAIARCNGDVNALPTLVPRDRLEAQAARITHAIRAGAPVGALAGLPYAAKDTHRTAGLRTTRGSPIFAKDVPTENDPIVQHLLDADALLIGKSNTPEFAAGSQTFNPVLGNTRNPWDRSRTVGGSSGGAAAALAAGMTIVADGSDLAASLRNPASFCGVAGLRPTSKSLPAMKMHANAFSTLSMVGPLARCIDDLRLINRAIFAPQPRHPIAHWAAGLRAETASKARGSRMPRGTTHAVGGEPRVPGSLRVAWTIDCGGAMPVAAPVREAIGAAVDRLGAAGVQLVEDAPDFEGADACFQTLRGLYFVEMLGELYRTDKLRMKDTVVWNVEFGLRLDSEQIAQATLARSRIHARVARFMAQYDAWLLPTAQVLPFSIEIPYPTEIEGRALDTYVDWLRSCSWISTAGHPAVSLNCGFASDGGGPPLPVGLQLMGRWDQDEALLDVAETIETLLAPALDGVAPP